MYVEFVILCMCAYVFEELCVTEPKHNHSVRLCMGNLYIMCGSYVLCVPV